MRISTGALLICFLTLFSTESIYADNKADVNSNPEKSQTVDVNTNKLLGKKIKVYTTSQKPKSRIKLTGISEFKEFPQPLETQICVFVDPTIRFQSFLGIGAALTDASAETYAKLPENKQKEFLQSYYSKEKGIGYTLARTHINSCDFSSHSYTYVKEGDKELNTFDISPDKKYRIPFIKDAIKAAGGSLTLYVSPWSPPAFMKDNDSMLHGGKLKPEYFQPWANYYVKFIDAYEKEGIPIWGMTVQNEPMAVQKWESCVYTAENERDFLKNYLGPTLHKNGLGSKKVIVWDHNRDLICQRANIILSDKEAAKYVWGIGFHWYETWSKGDPMFVNIARVHEDYPDKKLIFTEGCVESFDPKEINDWAHGERYGRSMINDFNNGCTAWTDWNILLNEKGGPNHVGNYCFAPVHANTKTGKLIFTSSYYYIGHFSKFIGKDANRISSAASRSQLLTTSFLNNSGEIVTIVMNQSDLDIDYFLCVGTNGAAISIPAHSIQTLIY